MGTVAAEPFGAAFVACGDDTCRKKDARIVYGVFYRVFCGDDGRDMASERAALSCGDDLTSGGNVGAYGKCAHRARTCPAERAPVFRIFHIFPAPMAGVVKK